MITEALHYLKENGKTSAELMVTASNKNALKLYQSMGYVISVEECNLGMIIE
jgi:ribosomal protein S18 acetylase RimI-like enzyme